MSLLMGSIISNFPTCYNLFITPKWMLTVFSWSFMHMHTAAKHLDRPLRAHILSRGWTRLCSAFLFQLSHCKQVSLPSLFITIFLHLSAFCCWFCWSKWFPNMVLRCTMTSVPQHQKAVMFLMEKMCLFCKLLSDMSYSAVHCDFNDNG